MGFVMLIAGLSISPSLVAWMSPTILGLLLAIFLSWGTGLLAVGLAARRAGLLTTPEEQAKPAVISRANMLTEEFARDAQQAPAGLAALHADPRFRAFHAAWLPHARARKRGDVSADHALAEVKLAEAETFDEALAWLHPKERMAVLQDPALVAAVSRLPKHP
jgi:membrane glycosyltransferase